MVVVALVLYWMLGRLLQLQQLLFHLLPCFLQLEVQSRVPVDITMLYVTGFGKTLSMGSARDLHKARF